MVRRYHAGLEREIRALTPPRHRDVEIDRQQRQLEENLIGTEEAARLLNWSTRKVQRHKHDLGVRLIGDRLIFERSAVLEHARREQNA
jgi:hypothetical protein